MIRSWDKNKDGNIQPIELRQAIRNSFHIQADNKAIDALVSGQHAHAPNHPHMRLPEMRHAGCNEVSLFRDYGEIFGYDVRLCCSTAP